MDPSPRLFRRADLVQLGLERPDRDPLSKLPRVRRGVYAEQHEGSGGQRYLATVHASALTLTGERIYSHESAAALHGLPILGPWPTQVHLLCDRRGGGRSQLDVKRHCIGLELVDVVVIDGLLATSLARTAFDFALSRPFAESIIVIDAVLARDPAAGEQLARLLDAYGRGRGFVRARTAIGFGDARSGSAGESYSRALMELDGFAPPELQVPVETDGRTEWGDFGWLELDALGEFDGEVKYRLDRYRMGGSVEDVVIREKNRENRMRVRFPNVARWDWTDLRRGRLGGILNRLGVPRRRGRIRRIDDAR